MEQLFEAAFQAAICYAADTAALVGDFAIVPGRLTSAGFGATRPMEANDTIAGRAHDRRVELVRDRASKP